MVVSLGPNHDTGDNPGERRPSAANYPHEPLDEIPKSRWERSWPVIACGAGLISDGYLQGAIGPVNTILKRIPEYKSDYVGSTASNITAIAFAGTVVGDLFFGWMADNYSRKWALMASTIILIVFAILSAGAWGAGGSVQGLFAALTAYRFLIGIGIGGEYPAGSVGCSESTGELKQGHRNRWFIFFTNFQIDAGFVLSNLVAVIVILITTEDHLETCWRVVLGIGAIPPLSLLYLRIKLQEPEQFNRETMKNTTYPWKLIIRFYWYRLAVVSLIWFIYDFSSYSFALYSSDWIATILGDGPPLWKSFGFSTVVNLFYIPGSFAGAFISDWIGPRKTLAYGVLAQGLVGFLMAGLYGILKIPQNVGGFIVIFGIFLTLGELGPGDNIGLVASKTSATCIRGQYYAVAAALGKIGAFVGTYVFPILQTNAGGEDTVLGGQAPVFLSSGLCLLSAVLAFFFLPHIGQDTIVEEDLKFREFLEANGWDTSQMGIQKTITEESKDAEK